MASMTIRIFIIPFFRFSVKAFEQFSYGYFSKTT